MIRIFGFYIISIIACLQITRTSSAAATRISVKSVAFSEACSVGVDGCDVSFEVCFLASSTASACDTPLFFSDTITDGETTWTPSVSPQQTVIEFGQTLPMQANLGVAVTFTRPGGAADSMNAFQSQAVVLTNVGSQEMTVVVDDTLINVQATVLLAIETICEQASFGDTCSIECVSSSDSSSGFFSCDADGNKICTTGYTGSDCKDDIDECSSSPCQNLGICTNTVGSYTCFCLDGCGGTNCETGTTSSVTRTLSKNTLTAVAMCPGISATFSGATILTLELFCGVGTSCLDGKINDNGEDVIEDVIENICDEREENEGDTLIRRHVT